VNATNIGIEALRKDRYVLGGAALVLLILGMTGWMLFGDGGDSDRPGTGTRYTHMHCSECGDEVPYTAAVARKPCVSCGKGTYLPTVGSVQETGGLGSPGAKIVFVLLLAAFLIQGLAFLGVWRLRVLRKSVEEVQNRKLVCRCPFCQRKLGYRASRIGSGIVCSQCKTAFTLPEGEEMEPQEAW